MRIKMSWHKIRISSIHSGEGECESTTRTTSPPTTATTTTESSKETSTTPTSVDGSKDLAMNEFVGATDELEADLKPSQEYAYLQGLNSDNLMQFSQQSMLQEMLLKEQFQGKPNLYILPTVEEHDVGGYNFKLSTASPHTKGKTSWNYSEDLNKLYIRMNDTFTVNAFYTPKFPLQPLRLRAFICFVKEVSEPVLRCQNHLSKDTEANHIKRESVLRCVNPNAEYVGWAEGNSIKDRFSVTLPLTAGITQNDNSVMQTIAFKFTCQNSCIGRKETCIMFLLEGVNGEILSQRILNVKICTCPKRDRAHDEKNLKRKSESEFYEKAAKTPRRESVTSTSTPPPPPASAMSTIKDESSYSDYETSAKQFDLQRTASGGIRLVMELSTEDIARYTLDYVIAKESANVLSESKEAKRSIKNIRKLRRLYSRF